MIVYIYKFINSLNDCKLVVSAFKDDWMIRVFLSLLQIFNKFSKYKYQKLLTKCYYYQKFCDKLRIVAVSKKLTTFNPNSHSGGHLWPPPHFNLAFIIELLT